ncbi:MAG: alpha/beta fold hydrolase [Dokdonella sp.]
MRADGDVSATVIVAPGAAAEARFYLPFCEYLCSTGVDVLIFDFRSIGESTSEEASRSCPGFSTWIEQDYPAVIAHARRCGRGKSLIVIGHSAGGWMAAAQSATDQIDVLIGVAALNGHWRHMAVPQRYAHWLAWHAVVPLACRTLGVWPGMIGFRKNLAPRFGLEFSRWARHRDFVFSEPCYAENATRFRGRMHLFQVADDPWGTEAAVHDFAARMPNARSRFVERLSRDPADPQSVGHFGAFRKSSADTLWPKIARAVMGDRRTVAPAASQCDTHAIAIA